MSKNQKTIAIFQYIKDYNQEFNVMPSMSEIADATGFASTGGVLRHLDKLERWGAIERYAGQARSIVIRRDITEDPTFELDMTYQYWRHRFNRLPSNIQTKIMMCGYELSDTHDYFPEPRRPTREYKTWFVESCRAILA